MDAPDYSKQVASDKSLGSNPQGPLKEQLYVGLRNKITMQDDI